MKTSRGTNQIDKEDRIIPRIVIGQPGSPEVIAGTHKFGDLYTRFQNYGTSFNFIPITWWKSRIDWADRKDGGGILCQATNALDGSVFGKCEECKLAQWQGQEPPICTAIINLIALIEKVPVAVSLMKTSYLSGKQLINLFDYKKVDIFNFQYELYTEKLEKDENIYNVIKYRDLNTPVSDEMYRLCEGIFDQFKAMGGRNKVQDVGAAE